MCGLSVGSLIRLLVSLEHDGKGFSRNIYFAKALHAFFASLLLSQDFLLSAYITPVKADGHVFAVGAYILTL